MGNPGPPIYAVVPDGSCQLGEEWVKLALLEKQKVSGDTYLFTFACPDRSQPLNLPTCACIMARGGTDAEGNPGVRPYTPMSTNDMIGQFQLMIKIYPNGAFGTHVKNLAVGAQVDFKHIKPNVKIQYPFGKKKHYGMLVGGTGITPMIQAMNAILGNEEDESKVSLLFGNKTEKDILAKSTLDSWSKSHSDRLTVTHVLSKEKATRLSLAKKWKGERGHITKELISKHFAPPSEDVLIFVCGPPAMYKAFCGPREERDSLTGILADMGYSLDQVYKF